MSELQTGDMTVGEMNSLVGTIFGVPGEEITDWLLVARMRCRECSGCGGSDLGVMCSRMHANSTDQPFAIHLAASAIQDLAVDVHEAGHADE